MAPTPPDAGTPPPPPGFTAPGIVLAGLRGLCPRCGAPTLFDGWVRFARTCRACALDFTAFNVGDGPAAFLTLIVGTIVTVGAIILQLAAQPPFWVHILLWVPLTLVLVLLMLRVAKGMLISSEYRNRAGEGRLSRGERDEP